MAGEAPSIKKILVPLDGSDSSFRAARYAVSLARMAGAEITCVHAIVNPPYIDYKTAGLMISQYIEEAKKHAEGWYEDVRDMGGKEGVRVSSETIMDVASIADSVVNYASEHKVDLIVIGTRGRSAVKRFLLGSVASGVVSHAECPVLVVR